jgi:prefoldin subunit 5
MNLDEEIDELESLQNHVRELASVQELVSHPGWRIVVNHFNKVLHAVSAELDVEENFEKIKRLQERKRAFKAMLETVDALCQEHSEALLRLESVAQDKQERDQYGQ